MTKKKSTVKITWGVILAIVILTVGLVGLVTRLTSGFTEFDPKNIFSEKLNQDNLFYDKLEDGNFYENDTVSIEAKNGKLTLNGKIADSDPNIVTVAEDIEVAQIELKAGTYTFTCFNKEKPSWRTYYATGTYVVDGVAHTWYADVDEAMNNSSGDVTMHGKTVELENDTVVTFEIHLCEGVELDDVKAIPVLVEGDENGKYSNGIFG